jgi:hypothetical protein
MARLDAKRYFRWGDFSFGISGTSIWLTQYVAPLLIPDVEAVLVPTPADLGMKGDYLALQIPKADLLVYPSWSFSFDTTELTVDETEIGNGMWSGRIIGEGNLRLSVNNCLLPMFRDFNIRKVAVVIKTSQSPPGVFSGSRNP